MTRLGVLSDRLSQLSTELVGFMRESMKNEETNIIDLQRTQLLSGKRADGKDITPLYTEDSYFKSAESAQRYADWKAKMTYPKKVERNPLAPNLYIAGVKNEGRFHSELGVEFREDEMEFVGTTAYSKKIMAKYPDTFGLTDESFGTIKDSVSQSLITKIKTYLNG